ncbi:MAG: hypothetical protein K0Q59_1721 [Paenibacillus sp.]|nr:hypothetical protein [Paenibacillus sp.]
MGLVIYPPTIDWSFMKQRPQHVMEQFARKGHAVLYFNKRNGSGPVIEKAAANLFVVRHGAYALDALIPKLSLQGGPLYWTSWSKKIPHAERFGPACTVIYDCVDDFPDWEEDERRWLGRANGIICTAERLESKMRQAAPHKPIAQVPNGCEWSFFNKAAAQRTSRIEGVPPWEGPRLGYIGAWAPWVDESLLLRLARDMPEAQIVIVGPKLRSDEPAFPENVVFAGYRNYSELPDLLGYMDVCLIPFRLNRITESTNPIKVYEYLAAGKPVVSTDLPEVRKLEPYVKVAQTSEQFVEAVKAACRPDDRDRQKRSLFAKQFSWDRRFSAIEATLESVAPMFRTADRLLADQIAPFARHEAVELPLIHATLNSYYRDGTFPASPAWTGVLGGGEYHCYMKLAKSGLPSGVHKLYLEFETDPAFHDEAEHAFWIGASSSPWSRKTITFRNRPHSERIGDIRAGTAFGETCSLDVTEFWRGGATSFHIRCSRDRVTPLYNPRLTAIIVPGASPEVGGL